MPVLGGSSGSGGAVASVNSKTGAVVLTASDVGADASGAATSAQSAAISAAATDATSKANAAQAAAIQRANHTGTQAATTITGLAAVATTGAYSDLTGKPTLGTAAAQSTTAFDAAGAASTAQSAAQTYADTGDAARIPKALGTAKGDLVGFSGSGTPVRIPAGGDGSVPTYDSTAAGGISAQAALNASSLLLGATNGALKKPWGPQSYISPELWSTTYFSTDTVNSIAGNTTNLAPSQTANGTIQKKMTRLRTGYGTADGQVQETYRFDYTVNNTVTSGWAWVAIRCLTAAGATVAGTEIYLYTASDGVATNYRSAIDYKTPPNSGARWIEIEVTAYSNASTGTIGLSNVSFRQVAEYRPSLNVSWYTSNASTAPNGTNGWATCDVPVVDPVTGVTTWWRREFGPDGQLQVSPTSLYNPAGGYTHNYVTPSTTGLTQNATSNVVSGTTRTLHQKNTGQIMGVVKGDNVTTELRCNTHGGEWGRRARTVTDAAVTNASNQITSATANFTSADVGAAISLTGGMGVTTSPWFITAVTNSTTATINQNATATATGVTLGIGNFANNFTFEMDFGDGNWVALTDAMKTHACRRFRITCHTEIMRSDAAAPFANVDNTFTVFDDGTMRFDRTITFSASQKMSQWFYFMHTFDQATPLLAPGRMGYGQQVIPGFDPRQYLATPAAPTVANSATGGTYGALTRTYYITAITPQGETLASPSASSTTASGTTNSFTVTFPTAATGQTGWGVYDSTGLLAKVPVSVTSWTDANPTFGTGKAPTISTATVLPGTQQYQRLMSDRVDWAAIYDQDGTSVVFGAITDRDNALTYPGAVALTSELESHPGVLKNYWQLFDGQGRQPVSDLTKTDSYTQTIASGTVLNTTAFTFTYAPLDRAQWHREIAARGQGFKQFGTVYPAT